MYSWRKNMKKKIVGILVCTLLIATAALPVVASTNVDKAKGEEYPSISMPNRPFAIDPQSLHQYFDGVFGVDHGEQIIGVFLLNEGQDEILNVTAKASFNASSGIYLIDDFEEFGDLKPGIPVLGFFTANFSNCSVDKHNLTLKVSGDSFYQTVSRFIFVARSEVDWANNMYTVFVPEGNITTELRSVYSGTSLGSFAAPTSFNQTVIYETPFAGQFGPVPFIDIWWKAAGLACQGVSYISTYCILCAETEGYDVPNWCGWAAAGAGAGGAIATGCDIKDVIYLHPPTKEYEIS